jgi:hypothetical protein
MSAKLTQVRARQVLESRPAPTIWTLRALLLAASKGTDGAVGSLDVAVDGATFTTLALTADQADVMTTVDLSTLATTGSHDVTLTFVGTGKVSYNLVAQYNVPWANAPDTPGGPLSISVSYDKTSLVLDETATATVVVKNNTASVQKMILVTLGLPPGFQVATEDLDQYKTSKVLSAYEITGKQLMLYLSALPASGTQTFKYRLQATMPVTASDGGAEVYLYYQPKRRPRYIRWAELLRRVFGIEILCTKCKAPLRLIALIKTEATARKILTAMHLPTEARACPPRPCPTRLRRARRQLHPARPPPGSPGVEGGEEQASESWLN